MEGDIFDQQRVEPVNLEDEIKVSYLDYAMSVIVGRALPDARDGLKPVHRRILFAMNELGNDYNKPYKKSARVVGDVIGKYHPHGDSAVYDALARLAQDFTVRYPLADGQGNFGSMDGDPPAAMRYTEVRLAKIAHEFMADIDKDTVDFGPNYDGSLEEPLVMPTRVPGLLVNGSAGIAVGMATNIPPHNLREVADGLIALIDDPDITVDALMKHIPGPDFPTGGVILGREGLRAAYHTGKGIIRLRAKASIETRGKDKRPSLVITEMPYQVNKASVVKDIDNLIREKRLDGAAEVRDESDRDGVRVVVDIKSGQRDLAETILNQLYHLTQLEVSFGIILLAVVNQAPRLLTLKEALSQFLEHRKEVVLRRTAFELAKAEARAHILEGLLKALDHLDAVIALIRASRTPAEAKAGLMGTFELSAAQAQAILDLRLQKLTQLERQALEDEYAAIEKDIARFKAILASEKLLLDVIRGETVALRDAYGDARRTAITSDGPGDYNPEDFIVDEDMVVTISHGGYIKRNSLSLYRAQKRGGKGVTAARTRDDDFTERLYIASTHDYLLFLTNRGRLFWLKVYEIPQAGRTSKGKALVNVIQLAEGEKAAAVLAVKDLAAPDSFVVMATRRGVVKRIELSAFQNPRKAGLQAIRIADDDELVMASLTGGQSALVLSTRGGKAICFKETDVRAMGRLAAGVKGITLAGGDAVMSMDVISPERTETLLTVTEKGFGKRTPASEYNLQSRGGQGTITSKTTPQKGQVVGVLKVTDDDRLMLITNTGRLIMVKTSEISLRHRNTGGVKLIEVTEGEYVVDVAPVGESEDEAGFCSRRAAERLIAQGLVAVNGQVVAEQGRQVEPGRDKITVGGRPVGGAQAKLYYMFNKPRGYLTTLSDPQGRPTIRPFLEGLPARVYPVGRLDMDVEGLLILTNDGDLARKLMHPSTEAPKTYRVKVSGRPDEGDLARLRDGTLLIGDRPAAPARAEVIKTAADRAWLLLTITEGRHHQVKRMCSLVGHPVLKLKRVAYGGLKLGDLRVGAVRPLSAAEVATLTRNQPLRGAGKCANMLP